MDEKKHKQSLSGFKGRFGMVPAYSRDKTVFASERAAGRARMRKETAYASFRCSSEFGKKCTKKSFFYKSGISR